MNMIIASSLIKEQTAAIAIIYIKFSGGNFMKKTLAILLSLLMIFGVFGVPFAFADYAEIYDGEIFDYDTKTVTIENPGDKHYFEFTPLTSGCYAFFSIGEIDTVGSIYDSEGARLHTNDDGFVTMGKTGNFFVHYNLEAGNTYRLECCAYFSGDTGSFDVRVISQSVQFQSYLALDSAVSATIPMNTVYSYTFTPTEDVYYYLLLDDGDYFSFDFYVDGEFKASFLDKKGYCRLSLKKDLPVDIYVHGSVNNASNTFTLVKEIVVDDGYVTEAAPKNITINNPYERHIVHFNPETTARYILSRSPEIYATVPYYIRENGNESNVGYDHGGYPLRAGTEYYMYVTLYSGEPTGTYFVALTNNLISAGSLTLDSVETVEIASAYETHRYSFTPETSGVYRLSATLYDEEEFDSYVWFYDADFNMLATNDDGNGNGCFLLDRYLEAGKTYYYDVSQYSERTGRFNMTLERADEIHTHECSEKTVYATCTEQGYTIYTCSCGYVYNGNYIEPFGHDITGFLSVPATCEDPGTEHFHCINCDYEYDVEIPATGHNYLFAYHLEPTCTEDGYDNYQCSNCGDLRSDPLPATGHNYEITWHEDPTCTEDGYDWYHCYGCGDSYSDPIPATGHSYALVGHTDPTCTEAGSDDYECSGCFNLKSEPISALGHSFTNYVYNNDATTEHDGTETATCDRCDETDTRVKAGTMISPTASAIIHAVASKDVDYRSKVTITAAADNVPEGYKLAVYDGSTRLASGDNEKVSYYVGEMKESKTFTIKVIDSSGIAQKDVDGNEIAANTKVNVNTGFFARIVALFRGIFRALPSVTVGPKVD